MTLAELTVHAEGNWFRVGEGQCIDLSSRSRYRVLLKLLVREHQRDPAAALTVSTLIREVWPEERLPLDVARNRVYVALCTLRKWGLEGLMVRAGQGYRIDANVHVTFAEPNSEQPARPGYSAIEGGDGYGADEAYGSGTATASQPS